MHGKVAIDDVGDPSNTAPTRDGAGEHLANSAINLVKLRRIQPVTLRLPAIFEGLSGSARERPIRAWFRPLGAA